MQQTENERFRIAADVIINTSRSVFLTGKAGTGKTTFLHYIRKNANKNVIVAAPTGVAAINAAGVTLHSLFQLPFEAYTPDFEGKSKLDFQARLRKSKIQMLRELELLIIDEVSMLRADMLDAIDVLLRRYRYDQRPFGGVQLLFIGDLFQLPPVVQGGEWERLKPFYETPFFFHAQALKKFELLHIELTTIFRQNEPVFIEILNRVRNNETTDQDIQLLNAHYHPDFQLTSGSRYILLSTHNAKVDRINLAELEKLPGETFVFEGKTTGDFNEFSLPAEHQLRLKKGAQVMFTKNDAGEHRRYYNGKLAQIVSIFSDQIRIAFEDGTEMKVEPETWKNIRYSLNTDTQAIIEEEIGTYRQYPLRLAWAITIHKSQGLTFDRVAIDAGRAFTSGQVYVALSRCTSLAGIVLFSPLSRQAIQTNPDIVEFSNQQTPLTELKKILAMEKPAYCALKLKMAFDWQAVVRTIDSFADLVREKKNPGMEKALHLSAGMQQAAAQQLNIASRFQKELGDFFFTKEQMTEEKIAHLGERVRKAVAYFHKEMQETLLAPLDNHRKQTAIVPRMKGYLKNVDKIRATLASFMERLEKLRFGNVLLTEGLVFEKTVPATTAQTPTQKEAKAPKEEKMKTERGDSVRITLGLFRQHPSIPHIAAERKLVPTTIENHLAQAVSAGLLSVYDLVPPDRVNRIIVAIPSADPKTQLSPIKQALGSDYTYLEIKAVLHHLLYLKAKSNPD